MSRSFFRLLAAALTGCAALPTAARAQQPVVRCTSPMTQQAMNICSGQEASRADARLRSLLRELYPKLDTARARQLRVIQARWTAYREQHCRWDADSYAGGSVWPMWYADCETTLTNERIDGLRLHLCNDDAGMAGECAASRRYDPYRRRDRTAGTATRRHPSS